jgi:uncharacterized repeat protein (TIGR03843 family)
MSEVIDHLLQGTLEVNGRLVDASNATLYATCSFSDQSIAVIYKPVAGERPLWDFPDGNLAQREYAAYLISQMGKFHVVPPTVLRDGPFGIGMVQQWIHIDEEIDLAEFYRTNNPQLRNMALFDAVVNNTDRKIGHLLPLSVERVLGCDHGVTFHEEDKLRTVLWQWADQSLSTDEIEQLQKLESEVKISRDELRNLITESEYLALLARINRLISEKVFPAPSDEWPAVPWPPF